jgi:ABC-type thiamine transport system ATPase subunit
MSPFINPLAGKSTLLQILAGKRLVTSEATRILIKGCDVFRNSPSGVTYLGTEWEVHLANDHRVGASLNPKGLTGP